MKSARTVGGRPGALHLSPDGSQVHVFDSSSPRVTVLGAAGVGKTRLASELAAEVGDQATVLTGRCLAYGDGITYWPLVELLRVNADEWVDELPEIVDFYDTFGDRIPTELREELRKLEARLRG